jgi:signal peptidase
MTEIDERTHVTEKKQMLAETRETADPSDSIGFLTRKRVVHGLGLLVLLALVVPFVVYAVPGLVGANASFVVLSGSMEPAISAGDVVVVATSDPSTIVAGDVITFSRGSSGVAVTHRVVDVDTSGAEPLFYTKGDANDNVDVSPVPASAVVGTVVLVIPFIGYVIQFAGTTLGFVLLVIVPIGLLLVTEAVSYLRTRRRNATAPSQEPTEDLQDASTGQSTADATEPAPVDAASEVSAEVPTEHDAVIAIGANDVLLSLGILVVAVPYVVYVAIQQQTPLSIGVAVGFATTLLLVGGIFLLAKIGSGRQSEEIAPVDPTGDAPIDSAGGTADPQFEFDPADPTADGGTTPEVSE